MSDEYLIFSGLMNRLFLEGLKISAEVGMLHKIITTFSVSWWWILFEPIDFKVLLFKAVTTFV